MLPLPAYFGGFTSGTSLTSVDLDADGALDLILVHQRNDGADLPGESFTGRYVQVLINQGGFRFEDRTAVWFGDQAATAVPEQDSVGRPVYVNADGDGCHDIAISGSWATGRSAPRLYLRRAWFEATLVRGLQPRSLSDWPHRGRRRRAGVLRWRNNNLGNKPIWGSAWRLIWDIIGAVKDSRRSIHGRRLSRA